MAADDYDALVREATAAVVARLRGAGRAFTAPVGVSGRHVHLSAGDLATLLGPGAALTPARDLGQPGQFAAAEAVMVVGPRASLHGVRVVGPLRPRTVVELAAGDLFALGLDAYVAAGETFEVVLAGPAGVLRLPDAGVVSRRHLHAPPADAERWALKDGDTVSARLGLPSRRATLANVLVRVAPAAALELHVDQDEANGCGARTGDVATIIAGGAADVSAAAAAPARGKRRLVTEAEVVAAHRRGGKPDVAGALLTPFARDALRRFFPELAAAGEP